eukprot:380761_1
MSWFVPISQNGYPLGKINMSNPLENTTHLKIPRCESNLHSQFSHNATDQMLFNALYLACYNCDLHSFKQLIERIPSNCDLNHIHAQIQPQFLRTLNKTDEIRFSHLLSDNNPNYKYGNNLLHATIAGIAYKTDKQTKKEINMNENKQLKNMQYIVEILQNKGLRLSNETLNISYTKFPQFNEVILHAPNLIVTGINMSYFKDCCHANHSLGLLGCLFWEGWDFVPLAENEKTPLFKYWYKYIEKGAVIPPFSFISTSKLTDLDCNQLTNQIFDTWFNGNFEEFLYIFGCVDNNNLSPLEREWIEEDYGFSESGYSYLRKGVMTKYRKMVKLFIKKTLNAIMICRNINKLNECNEGTKDLICQKCSAKYVSKSWFAKHVSKCKKIDI